MRRLAISWFSVAIIGTTHSGCAAYGADSELATEPGFESSAILASPTPSTCPPGGGSALPPDDQGYWDAVASYTASPSPMAGEKGGIIRPGSPPTPGELRPGLIVDLVMKGRAIGVQQGAGMYRAFRTGFGGCGAGCGGLLAYCATLPKDPATACAAFAINVLQC